MAISGEGVANSYSIDFEGEDDDIAIEALLEERSIKANASDLISFVIPAYNEGEKLYRNLQECNHCIMQLGMPYEIVIVNDGSKDNTLSEIERFADNHPEVVPVTYPQNAGKGNALKAGSRRARGNIVVFLDADMEIHPSQTARFIEEMKRTEADVVIGSKRHPDSKVDYPLKRKFLSWGYHLLIRTMFDLKISDTQPGFKVFKKEVLDRELCKIRADRYAFDLDLLVNASGDGFKIVEAPIELNFSRKHGGRLGFHSISSIFGETMGIYSRQRARKRGRSRASGSEGLPKSSKRRSAMK